MLFVILKIEVTANQHRDEIVLAPRGFRAVLRPSAGPAAVPTSHRPCPTGTSPAPWRPTPSAIPRRCSWGGPHHPSLPRVRWGRARATLGASHSQSCLSSQVSFLPDDSRLWSALRASLCRPARLLSPWPLGRVRSGRVPTRQQPPPARHRRCARHKATGSPTSQPRHMKGLGLTSAVSLSQSWVLKNVSSFLKKLRIEQTLY